MTAFDVLLRKAYRYYEQVYAREGSPPRTFVLSEAEYALLERSMREAHGQLMPHAGGPDLYICGMRVVPPACVGSHAHQTMPIVNSESSPLEDWEAGVHAMIADVHRRHGHGA